MQKREAEPGPASRWNHADLGDPADRCIARTELAQAEADHLATGKSEQPKLRLEWERGTDLGVAALRPELGFALDLSPPVPGERLLPGRVERTGQVGPRGEPDALDAGGPDCRLLGDRARTDLHRHEVADRSVTLGLEQRGCGCVRSPRCRRTLRAGQELGRTAIAE